MEVVSIDLFIVPMESEKVFREESDMVRRIIKSVPGLVEGFFYERTSGDGEYNFITMAVWESEETFSNAGKAVWTEFQKIGFNPQQAHDRLRVNRIQSVYKRTAY